MTTCDIAGCRREAKFSESVTTGFGTVQVCEFHVSFNIRYQQGLKTEVDPIWYANGRNNPCTFWTDSPLDPIKGIGERAGRWFCPTCGGQLGISLRVEYENAAAALEEHQVGYQEFLWWLRGRCFPNYDLAKARYFSETGRRIV